MSDDRAPAWPRLVAIAATAPAVLLLPLALRGGWRLLGAVIIYPVAAGAAALLLWPLHRTIRRRGLGPLAQLRIVVPAALLGGPAAYVAGSGLSQFQGGISGGDVQSLGAAAGLGAVVAGVTWVLYNWGPLRLRPAASGAEGEAGA